MYYVLSMSLLQPASSYGYVDGENDLEHSLKVTHWFPILAAHPLCNMSIERAQISKSSEDWRAFAPTPQWRVNPTVCGLTLGPPGSSMLQGQPIICIVHYLIPSADIYERSAPCCNVSYGQRTAVGYAGISEAQSGKIENRGSKWAYFISDTRYSVETVRYFIVTFYISN